MQTRMVSIEPIGGNGEQHMLIWYPPNRHARLASVIVRVIRSAIILARWFGSRRGVGLGNSVQYP